MCIVLDCFLLLWVFVFVSVGMLFVVIGLLMVVFVVLMYVDEFGFGIIMVGFIFMILWFWDFGIDLVMGWLVDI